MSLIYTVQQYLSCEIECIVLSYGLKDRYVPQIICRYCVLDLLIVSNKTLTTSEQSYRYSFLVLTLTSCSFSVVVFTIIMISSDTDISPERRVVYANECSHVQAINDHLCIYVVYWTYCLYVMYICGILDILPIFYVYMWYIGHIAYM